MPHFICQTCGSEFAESAAPPDRCPICQDERQYVGSEGQQWTTMADLRQGHRNAIQPEEPGLTGIVTEPGFAIGQRALLVQTPAGNVLWDCVSLLDDATVQAVRALGGVAAIAVSHPHFYSGMVEWSHAFDAPIYLHRADEKWVMRPDSNIQFWEGERQPLVRGLTLVRCGGHFEGSAVLHWPAGAGGRGALLSGDTLQVAFDRGWVSFMRSFPNYIPLPAGTVRRVVAAVNDLAYDRIYGAWPGRVVAAGAKQVVARSAERYIAALSE